MTVKTQWEGEESQKWTAGARHVSNVGIPGSSYVVVMDPDDADAAAADTERWLSATGALWFNFIPKAPAEAVTSLEGIIVGWSTTASDLTAVNALMATVDTGLTTPGSGGTEVTNCMVLLPVKQADGTTGWVSTHPNGVPAVSGSTIKTIAVRSSGAEYPEGGVLVLVV
jgi:hypothetical protein